MTLRLFGNWFSPFARKVALGLETKGLEYAYVDGLAERNKAELTRLNPRAEVPTLQDGDLVVANSADILQYLDHAYPERPLAPESPAERVQARALERLADTRLDAILVDCSYWSWAERDDRPPVGLLEAGQRDLERIFARLEEALAGRPSPWPFAEPGLLECAWFPHLVAVRPLGFTLDAERFPRTGAWLGAMAGHPLFAADARRTASFLKEFTGGSEHERRRLAWRGDRIEWLLARGFHDWLRGEIESGRAFFPD